MKRREFLRMLAAGGAASLSFRTGAGSMDALSGPCRWSKLAAPRIIDVPNDLEGNAIRLSLSNESKSECKFFGHALMA